MIVRPHYGPNGSWCCVPSRVGLEARFYAPQEIVFVGKFDNPLREWLAVKELVQARGLQPGPPPWQPPHQPTSF